MNKLLRRKKKPRPYQPKKRKPSKRVRRYWDGVVTDSDRYWAAHDPRQLGFAFVATPVTMRPAA